MFNLIIQVRLFQKKNLMGLDRWDTFKFQIMLYFTDKHKFTQAYEYKKLTFQKLSTLP